MNEIYYKLVLRASDGDVWTLQDKFDRPINFSSEEAVKQAIKEYFQDPKVVEASIFKIEKTMINTVKNIDEEFETAKDRISDVFMSVDLEKRAKLLEFFKDNFNESL
jgi:hypothetical protein